MVGDASGRAASRAGCGRTAVIVRCGRPSWRNVGVELEHDVGTRPDAEDAVAGERAEDRELDAVGAARSRQLRQPIRCGTATTIRSCASLSQISHGARPGYFSGASARSTSAPTPSAISPIAEDSPPAPQSVIAEYSVGARRREQVDQQLLGDRVADLHARAGDVAGGGVHRRAGERRAAEAVATGAAAEHDDEVAGVRSHPHRRARVRRRCSRRTRAGWRCSRGRTAPRRRRSAGRSCCRSRRRRRRHRARRGAGAARPVGSVGGSSVGRAEAEDVGDRDRTMTCAHHVADDAADAGVRAAERLDRRRMVVRLGLHRERRAGRERDDAGVADERAAHERARRWRPLRRAAGASSGATAVPSSKVISARNVLCAQCSLHVWASVSSSTSVGVAPELREVRGDRTQLLQVERHPALAVRARGARRRRGRACAMVSHGAARVAVDERTVRSCPTACSLDHGVRQQPRGEEPRASVGRRGRPTIS